MVSILCIIFFGVIVKDIISKKEEQNKGLILIRLLAGGLMLLTGYLDYFLDWRQVIWGWPAYRLSILPGLIGVLIYIFYHGLVRWRTQITEEPDKFRRLSGGTGLMLGVIFHVDDMLIWFIPAFGLLLILEAILKAKGILKFGSVKEKLKLGIGYFIVGMSFLSWELGEIQGMDISGVQLFSLMAGMIIILTCKKAD